MRAPMEIAYTSSLWRYRYTRFELQPKRLCCASRATTYTYKCGDVLSCCCTVQRSITAYPALSQWRDVVTVASGAAEKGDAAAMSNVGHMYAQVSDCTLQSALLFMRELLIALSIQSTSRPYN